MLKECLTCNKIFTTFPSRIKAGIGRYCSNKCKPSWANIIRECLTCKKTFKTFPCRIKKGAGKYCSWKCRPFFWGKGKRFSGIGEKNPAWKGNNITYGQLHRWIKQQLGKPSVCSDCGTTTAPKYEWANISGKYRRDIKDFKRLCAKCHHNFDSRYGKHPNSKLTGKDVIEIRKECADFKGNYEFIGKKYGVTPSTIGLIARNRSWKNI